MTFLDAGDFEAKLIREASSILSLRGQVAAHQRLGTQADGQPWTVDLIFVASAGRFKEQPIFFEFKYSRTPTLPQATFTTVLARFAAVKQANVQLQPRFMFVTNGCVPYPKENIDRTVEIFEGIQSAELWGEQLDGWVLEHA